MQFVAFPFLLFITLFIGNDSATTTFTNPRLQQIIMACLSCLKFGIVVPLLNYFCVLSLLHAARFNIVYTLNNLSLALRFFNGGCPVWLMTAWSRQLITLHVSPLSNWHSNSVICCSKIWYCRVTVFLNTSMKNFFYPEDWIICIYRFFFGFISFLCDGSHVSTFQHLIYSLFILKDILPLHDWTLNRFRKFKHTQCSLLVCYVPIYHANCTFLSFAPSHYKEWSGNSVNFKAPIISCV